jgi:hypothetical protein
MVTYQSFYFWEKSKIIRTSITKETVYPCGTIGFMLAKQRFFLFYFQRFRIALMTTMNVISGGLLANVIEIRNICTLTAKEVAIYVSCTSVKRNQSSVCVTCDEIR